MSNDSSAAYNYAMRVLGLRAHSVAEIERKMRHKGFSDDLVRETISDLQAKSYLNDHRFAVDMVRSLLRRKDIGRFYVRLKLADHGVDADIIDDVITDEYPEEKEREEALKAANKKKESLAVKLSKVSRNQKVKIAQHLSSRGFSADIIKETLDNL